MTCNSWAHHETAKCPGCPLWCVLRSLKTLPGYLLVALSPFSNRITQSWMEGKQQRRDSGKIQKAFRGENVKEHSSLYKKRILKKSSLLLIIGFSLQLPLHFQGLPCGFCGELQEMTTQSSADERRGKGGTRNTNPRRTPETVFILTAISAWCKLSRLFKL